MEDRRPRIDIVIITALQKELDAVLAQSDAWVKADIRNDSIRTCFTTRTANGVSVVAACAQGMGQLNAALVAYDVIRQWVPKRVILVGIAAGIGNEVELGDVVVSEQVVDYELQKITEDDTQIRWSVYRCDAQLINIAAHTKTDDWTSKIRVTRPQSRDPETRGYSRSHVGIVLSGNKVIANASQAAALKSVWVRARAIEMEATGVAAAVDQTPESKPAFIMVKGVSDKADSLKDDTWQEYAAHAAAAFAWHLACQLNPQTPASPNFEHERGPVGAGIATHEIDFRGIRFTLESTLVLADLQKLAFDLSIDWENLEGTTKDMKILSLLIFCKRHKLIQRMIDYINQDHGGLLAAYSPNFRSMRPG